MPAAPGMPLFNSGKYRYCHRYRNTDAGHLDILFRMGPDPCEHPEGQPHYKKPCPCTHQDVLRRVNSQEVPADGDQRTYEPRHNPKRFRKFPANRGAAEQGRYAQTVTFKRPFLCSASTISFSASNSSGSQSLSLQSCFLRYVMCFPSPLPSFAV